MDNVDWFTPEWAQPPSPVTPLPARQWTYTQELLGSFAPLPDPNSDLYGWPASRESYIPGQSPIRSERVSVPTFSIPTQNNRFDWAQIASEFTFDSMRMYASMGIPPEFLAPKAEEEELFSESEDFDWSDPE